jgi:hypothetical protein
MTIIELSTKKKLSDIKQTENTIDKEYSRRLAEIRCTDDLRNLLRDYEDFMPAGIMRFRDAPEKACQELVNQVRRIFEHIRVTRSEMIMEPTEAAILVGMPMIRMPRVLAMQLTKDAKRGVTWGEAFLHMSVAGTIAKLLKTQDMMYKRVIELGEELKDHPIGVDTTYAPGELNKVKS